MRALIITIILVSANLANAAKFAFAEFPLSGSELNIIESRTDIMAEFSYVELAQLDGAVEPSSIYFTLNDRKSKYTIETIKHDECGSLIYKTIESKGTKVVLKDHTLRVCDDKSASWEVLVVEFGDTAMILGGEPTEKFVPQIEPLF